MRYSILFAGAAGLAFAGFAGTAQAEKPAGDPNAPDIYSVYGTSVTVGGGVVGFTDGSMRDFASTGGAWDARLVFGTREYLAVEAAYTGGAIAIDALGLDNDADLLSSGAEVLGRVNLLTKEWQPYVVAGVGWRHYSIINSNRNTSSVQDNEDLGEIPLGAGVAYRYRGLVVDGRALFRAAFKDDLVNPEPAGENVSLNSWQTQITAGWEF
jgi:hypothetical protein